MDYNALKKQIEIVTDDTFEAIALAVFRYQAETNPLYKRYIELLKINPDNIQNLHSIPFLPIAFFKSHLVQSGTWTPEVVFESSGTRGIRSKHAIRSLEWYNTVSRQAFKAEYGNVEKYCFLALLPSYLERKNASLVYMVDQFIRQSSYTESDFYLSHTQALEEKIQYCNTHSIPTIVIGVSFALLDWAEAAKIPLKDTIVMETGGMKGRRKEITRAELHTKLQHAFAAPHIHSEYGMTELLSQAYAPRDGIFKPPPTMHIIIRDITDPFALLPSGRNGAINIIDLANIDTCAFIATDDIGRTFEDNTFMVLGRLDGSEPRGCSLLI